MANIDYQAHQEYLRTGSRDAQKSFDQTFILLAAGTITLSTAFAQNIHGSIDMVWTFLAGLCIVAFSLFVILGAFLLSQIIFDRLIVDLNNAAEKAANGNGRIDSKDLKKPYGLVCAVSWLTGIAIVSFVTGSTFLLIFVTQNV